MPSIDELLTNLTAASNATTDALEENARAYNSAVLSATKKSDVALDNLKNIRNQDFSERLINGLFGGPEHSRQAQLRILKAAQIRAGNAAARKKSADDLAEFGVRQAATEVELSLKSRQVKAADAQAKTAKVQLERQRGAAGDEAVNRAVFDIPEDKLQIAIERPGDFKLKPKDVPEIRSRLRKLETAALTRDLRGEQLKEAQRINEARDLQSQIGDIDPRNVQNVLDDLEGHGFKPGDRQEILAYKDGIDSLARAAEIQKEKLIQAEDTNEANRIKLDEEASVRAVGHITSIPALKALIGDGQQIASVVNTLSGPLTVNTAALKKRLSGLQSAQRDASKRTSASFALRREFDTALLGAFNTAKNASRRTGMANNQSITQAGIELAQINDDVVSGLEVTAPVIARIRQLKADVEKEVDRAQAGVPKAVQQADREFAANQKVSVATARSASGFGPGNQGANSIWSGSREEMAAKITEGIAASSGDISFADGKITGSTKKRAKDVVDGWTNDILESWKAGALAEANRRSWGLVFTTLNEQYPDLGFDTFLSAGGGGQLSSRFTLRIKATPTVEAHDKFDSGLIGSAVADFAKKLETAAADTDGALAEGVNGIEFITDTIKTIFRGAEYQSRFAQLIAPVDTADGIVHELFIPTNTIERTNETSILFVLDLQRIEQERIVVQSPIDRAKQNATNPMMNIFRGLGLGRAGGTF